MSSTQKTIPVLSSMPNHTCQTLTLSITNVTTIPHMTVKGEINQRIVHYLLNCSATANFISKSFAKKLNLIPISRLNKPVRELGGKILSNALLYIYYLWYILQGIPFKNTFIGVSTGKYQVVLGLPWFHQVNSRIDQVDLWVQFQGQPEHSLDIQETIPLLDWISFRRQNPTLSATIESYCISEPDILVPLQYQDYVDIFNPKATQQLPPIKNTQTI